MRAWYRGQRDNLEEIQQQARLYLQALAALLRSVREHAAECLFAWPPKFTLPGGAGIRQPLLSRLAFFARYESLLRCLAIREARAEARPTQVLLGQVIELGARTPTEMEVAGNLVVEPEADNFPAWLLVRDSDDGRRAQIEYGDYWYRNKMHGGPDSDHRAVIGIQNVSTDTSGKTVLRLSYARNFKEHAPRPGRALPALPALHRFHDRHSGAVPGTARRGHGRGAGRVEPVPATAGRARGRGFAIAVGSRDQEGGGRGGAQDLDLRPARPTRGRPSAASG